MPRVIPVFILGRYVCCNPCYGLKWVRDILVMGGMASDESQWARDDSDVHLWWNGCLQSPYKYNRIHVKHTGIWQCIQMSVSAPLSLSAVKTCLLTLTDPAIQPDGWEEWCSAHAVWNIRSLLAILGYGCWLPPPQKQEMSSACDRQP